MNGEGLLIALGREQPVWEVIPDRSMGDDLRWVPITVADLEREIWLGLEASGLWVLGVPENAIAQRVAGALCFTGDEYSFLPLVPLLDREPMSVRSDAIKFAGRHRLSTEAMWEALPWSLAIATALRSGRDYNYNLALDWLEELGAAARFERDLRRLASGPFTAEADCRRIARLIEGGPR